MWLVAKFLLLVVLFLGEATSEINVEDLATSEEEAKNVADRDGKLLPLFQVVKFKNEFCTSTSTSRNGTCYTRYMSQSIQFDWIYKVWAILNNWCCWLDQVDFQVTCCDCFCFDKLKLQKLATYSKW